MKKILQHKYVKFIQGLVKNILDHDVTGMAAQLAYFFLLSLFPLLLFVITLLPYTPLEQQDFLGMIESYAPAEIYNLIDQTLQEILSNRSGGLLSIGIVGTLWSASNGLNALMRSLNRAYDVTEDRNFFIARGLAVVLTVAMILVFIIALILPVFGKQLGVLIFSTFGLSDVFLQIWTWIRWGITPLIIFIIFWIVFFFAPNMKITIRSAIPGALFSALGWIIVSFGFSQYVTQFGNYSATYGSIGAVIILMLWFYISGIIIIIGGEINSYLSKSSS